MNERLLTSLRLGTLAVAAASLSGCVAQVAHAVFSPVLDSAAEASLTPEKVGISTSSWRGQSCEQLQQSYASMADIQQRYVVSGDHSMSKTTGWQLDAINQVRREQGCLGGTPSVAASGQVAAYGYCFASTSKANYLTPAFTYQDFYADSGAAETAAFNAMLRSTYGVDKDWGACLMEDSPAKAAAAIEQKAGLTTLIIGWETVRVAWTPPSIPKVAKAAPVVASTIAAPAPASLPASSNSQALGMTLQSPSAEMVKALGLSSSAGAWVVSVAPDSPAAKAGLKPLDVILDVSGQEIRGPEDVQAIAGRLRAGYRASLGIWRARAAKELTLEVPARAAVTSTATAPVPTATTPLAAIAPATPPAPKSSTFCHAYVHVVNQPGGLQSEIFESSTSDLSAAAMIGSLSAFVSKVRQLHPNDWRPFSFAESQCTPAAGYCFGNGENPLFGGKQMAGQFCYASREQAQQHYDEFNAVKPVYQTVQLKP